MRPSFELYKKMMFQTRALGIVGLLLVILSVAREVAKFFFALSINEGPIEISVIRNELYLVGLAILVGILAGVRMGVLALGPSGYIWHILSWLLLAGSLCVYVYSITPISSPAIHCTDDGICFGIYEMRNNTNFIAITGGLYVLLSLPRFLITFAYALIRYRFT